MEIYDAIVKRRTIRRFKQDKLQDSDIMKIINCGRLAAFGANLQPLKYAVINDGRLIERIHPLVKWAAYLPDWNPSPSELPAAYIAVIADGEIKPPEKSETDAGAAVTQMMLGAMGLGIGSCWLGAIDRAGIKRELCLDENLSVMYLLAIGYPAQEGSAFDMEDGNVKYYFDEQENVHVPKRKMSDIIVCAGGTA